MPELLDEMLSPRAAAYCGCSRTLLFAEVAKGNLRTRVVGGRVFFERGSLDELRQRLQERRADREAARAGAA